MNSFNKLPRRILNIHRSETIFECVTLSENLVKALDAGLDEKRAIDVLCRGMVGSGYENYRQPTFDERYLSKLFKAYADKDIDDKVFDKITSTIRIDLEGDDCKSLYGDVPIYDIPKYLDKKYHYPLEDCLNTNGIRDVVARFAGVREKGEYPFINYIKFTTTDCDTISESVYKDDYFKDNEFEMCSIDSDSFSEDVKNISSFCDEIVYNFNNKSPNDFVNYLFYGRKTLDKVLCLTREYDSDIYLIDRNDSIGENLQLASAIKKALDEKLLDKEEIKRICLSSYRNEASGDIDNYSYFENFSFKSSEILALVNSLSSKEIDIEAFDKLSSTFDITVSGDTGVEKSIMGKIKIYDIEDYLENKDTKNIEDCIDIENVGKIFKNFENLGDYFVDSMDFYFKDDSRLIAYVEAINTAIENNDRDKLGEILTDEDLKDFYKEFDVSVKPKEIELDFGKL